MGKHRWKLLGAALLAALIIGFALRDSFLREYVRLRSDALEAFAQSALADCGGEDLSLRYGSWPVSVWAQAGMVEFHTRQSAAFGGIERGFYYSRDDVPGTFQGGGYPLRAEDGGWRWEDPYGNHGETWRILPHWFWYKAVL